VIQAFLVTAAFVLRFHSDWLLLSLYIGLSGLILLVFFITSNQKWKVTRYALIDTAIKGKLKVLKERNIFILVSFRILEIGTYALLLFTCFVPSRVPGYVSLIAMGFWGCIVVIRFFKKQWVGTTLQFALYLMIPFIIYVSATDMAPWMLNPLERPYNLSFGLLALFVILTLKFTRRRKGFKVTPMDFLILFIALVVPNLPDTQIQSYHMGLIAAKIIVLFFTYEVLIGELRGKLSRLGFTTIAALVIIAVRGMV